MLVVTYGYCHWEFAEFRQLVGLYYDIGRNSEQLTTIRVYKKVREDYIKLVGC